MKLLEANTVYIELEFIYLGVGENGKNLLKKVTLSENHA